MNVFLWDVVEAIKQCSHQDKLLTGFSIWELHTSLKHPSVSFLEIVSLITLAARKVKFKCKYYFFQVLSFILCIALSLAISFFPTPYNKFCLIYIFILFYFCK